MVLTVRIAEGREFHSKDAEKALDLFLVFTSVTKSFLVPVERSC